MLVEAERLLFGINCKKNAKAARRLIEESATKNNNLFAKSLLGSLYLDGTGGATDHKKAFELFYASSEFAESQYHLGVCYQFGYGTKKNIDLAIEWYEKAAKNQCPDATYNLGVIYEEGTGVEKNLKKAKEYYADAVNLDCVDAMLNLSIIFESEGNVAESLDLLQRAAAEGDPSAICQLGYAYFTGEGFPQDMDKAFQLYAKSAESGYAPAQHNLGLCYLSGDGCETNTALGIRWLRRAADQEYEPSINELEELSTE